MRAMVICAAPVYPPVGGAALRSWATVQWLRTFAEVGVYSVAGKASPPPPGIPPERWCGAGSAARMETSSDWMRRPTGMPSDGFFEADAVEALRRFVRDFAPEVAVLETFWVHRYYEVLREAGVPVILNAHNVEADVMRQLEAAERPSPVKLQRRILVQRMERAERMLAQEMQQIWVCSEEDGVMLRRDYDLAAPIPVVPNAVDPALYRGSTPRPGELNGTTGPVLIFPAGFHYPPNQNAARFLVRSLLPRIAASHADTRVLLPGFNPTPEMLEEAARDPRVIVTGLVEDMLPYLQHSSVLVVPLTEGGGTRFKIIEAFATRVPVVSSAKGAEGLGAVPGEHYLAAESAEEFETAVRRVLDDRAFAEEMVERAAAFADGLWERAGAAMRASLTGRRAGSV